MFWAREPALICKDFEAIIHDLDRTKHSRLASNGNTTPNGGRDLRNGSTIAHTGVAGLGASGPAEDRDTGQVIGGGGIAAHGLDDKRGNAVRFGRSQRTSHGGSHQPCDP